MRSESAKHRAAVASVISSVAIAILYTVVAVDVFDQLGLPIGSLVAPAAVLGAALGFGAQRIVQDLLSGFFIITEKQYGFGDLVTLTVTGSSEAQGTVEDVTLRVTKLRTSDGEVFTIPNGQIVKALNLSKDWARAVVDIPVPTTADLNKVNDVLHDVATAATSDKHLEPLLLDEPALMGVESIKVDTVNLRMVARTCRVSSSRWAASCGRWCCVRCVRKGSSAQPPSRTSPRWPRPPRVRPSARPSSRAGRSGPGSADGWRTACRSSRRRGTGWRSSDGPGRPAEVREAAARSPPRR